MLDFERRAEAAYSAMYVVTENTAAAGHYNDAKYFFAQAIGCAESGGLSADEQRLTARLNHVREVFRRQFCS